jgi:hypothetical protein
VGRGGVDVGFKPGCLVLYVLPPHPPPLSLLLLLVSSIDLRQILQLPSADEILLGHEEDALGRESEVILAELVAAEISVRHKFFCLVR